jgi:hypothetical protein
MPNDVASATDTVVCSSGIPHLFFCSRPKTRYFIEIFLKKRLVCGRLSSLPCCAATQEGRLESLPHNELSPKSR